MRTPQGVPGNVVLGTLDREWRVTRISQDVEEMLGFSSDQLMGSAALGILHPADAAEFLAAVEEARLGHRTVQVVLRFRTSRGDWVPVAAVLAALTDDHPPALAFAMVTAIEPDAIPRDAGEPGSRPGPEALRPIRHLSDLARFSALARLTTREWQILVLLLDGERVPSIAAALYLSPSTIRNHLSSIFSKVGVHSQSELIHLLRSP